MLFSDPSGHCWGNFEFVRKFVSYNQTCENLEAAWFILTHPEETLAQPGGTTASVLAATYVVGEVVAHAVVVVYGAKIVIEIVAGEDGEPEFENGVTVEEFEAGRAEYEEAVRGIPDRAQDLIDNHGYSEEQAARWAFEERQRLQAIYKAVLPREILELIRKSNIEIYGNPNGPNIEDYIDAGRTWREMIESAGKPGGADIIPQILDYLINSSSTGSDG
jgi:hypothetical protein